MKRFVIERELPGAGKLSSKELEGISQKSCGVLHEMGSNIQWIESFVTGDKVYCVYTAANEALVREHAKLGGFPVTAVAEVSSVIGPHSAGPDYVPGA